MKKMITKTLLGICMSGMAVTLFLNFCFQIYISQKNFRNMGTKQFWQIEQIVKEKQQEIEDIKASFAEDCIIRARAAAYIAEHYPNVVESREESVLVASLLQVDELHFFNKEGEIFAGTHPQYYGFNFESGEQIAFFAPLLENHTLELCQDITPNTAEQKLMQYTAVWTANESMIVQVGLTPERVLSAIEGNKVSDIFAMISTNSVQNFYAINLTSGMIEGSTNAEATGKDYSYLGLPDMDSVGEANSGHLRMHGVMQYYYAEKTDNYLLVTSSPIVDLYGGVLTNSALLFLYFMILFMVIILAINDFLNRKITGSIMRINGKLKEIEQGNWNTELSEDSTEEFAQLSKYINHMVSGLLDFSGKISKALELSDVPIGICEYVPETGKFTATSRVKDILNLTDDEYAKLQANPELLEEMKDSMEREDIVSENEVYCLGCIPERYVRFESFPYKDCKMILLTDVTEDVMEKMKIVWDRDTDPLTGLYNRRAFYRYMEDCLKHPELLKNAVFVMIDLDNLKTINDCRGHGSGDLYIMAMAEVLHLLPLENVILGRIGGDEFALFIYGYDSREELGTILHQLYGYQGKQPVLLENDENIMLHFSMGSAMCPSEGGSLPDLMKKADERMYEQKRARKQNREDS